MRQIVLDPAQDVHSTVAPRRPVARNTGTVEEFEILVGFCCRSYAVPNPRDHASPRPSASPTTKPLTMAAVNPSAICPVGSSSGSKMVTCMPTARSELNAALRSEEHTSELQSRQYLVCRLLLEKKQKF